jgi:YVTN family beta-propeller protein
MSARSMKNKTRTILRRPFLLNAAIVVLVFAAGLAVQRTSTEALPQGTQNLSDVTPRYLNPTALKLSPDGKRLYVVCEASDVVLVVDTNTRQVIGRIHVGTRPEGIAISPDGKTLYVSNEWSNSVSEIDPNNFRILRTLKTGWGPVGITTDRAGKFLYTANTLGDNVSVINLSTGKEIKRLDAGHFPEYVDLSRDGKWIYVSNLLAQLAPPDVPPVAELTVINTAKQIVSSRISVPGAIQLRHIAQVPARDGGYLLIPFQQPHNLVPLVSALLPPLTDGWRW